MGFSLDAEGRGPTLTTIAKTLRPPTSTHGGPSLPTLFPKASRCGEVLVTGPHYTKVLDVWDFAAGKATQTIDTIGDVRSLAFSPDGKQLAVAAFGRGLLSLVRKDSSSSMYSGKATWATPGSSLFWR